MTDRFEDPQVLGDLIFRTCSCVDILIVGDRLSKVADTLTNLGLSVRMGLWEPVPGRISLDDAANPRSEAGRFGTVLCDVSVEGESAEDLPALIDALASVTERHLVLGIRGDCLSEPGEAAKCRLEWEAICYAIGFRKHPAYYDFNDYEGLRNESLRIVIPLEKIAASAVRLYPLAALKRERSLHMDMMREAGSRSDAHIIRYALAARYIRPGDRVIDAACGLGYGTHVLSQLSMSGPCVGYDDSEFATAYAEANYGRPGRIDFVRGRLPECLSGLPDHSIDVVVSFETLEHVEDSEPLLSEFRRILTPGGRIVASVPADWSDETGRDPNPYHLQVYTLPGFVEQIGRHFSVEKLFRQIADRVKSTSGVPGEFVPRTRLLRPIDRHGLNEPIEAEWVIAVADKTLLGGEGVAYVDRMFTDEERRSAGRALMIAEHYDNPWIFRSLVSIGLRIDDAELRRQ